MLPRKPQKYCNRSRTRACIHIKVYIQLSLPLFPPFFSLPYAAFSPIYIFSRGRESIFSLLPPSLVFSPSFSGIPMQLHLSPTWQRRRLFWGAERTLLIVVVEIQERGGGKRQRELS